MRREAQVYLWDLLEAAQYLLEVPRRLDYDGYLKDRTQQLAVERSFIIIGEAVAQIGHHFPKLYAELEDRGRIVAFRDLRFTSIGTSIKKPSGRY